MIDSTKCLWGLPTPSGYVRQCPLAPAATETVQASDKQSPEPMGLCTVHHGQLLARKTGTIYRENAAGTGVPAKVILT